MSKLVSAPIALLSNFLRNVVLRILLIICFIFSSIVHADDIDTYVNSVIKKNKIPSITIAIVKDGQIVKSQGYGLANVELNTPATPNTIYQSGSVGKQFTATLIMQLVKEGKLSLDDKISKYLKNTPASWKNITIRHLLTHTSGIREYYDLNIFNYRLDYSDAEILSKIEKIPMEFKPGDQWSYSNSGYILLGFIIQKVTGKFYGELLQDRIFKPLEMNTARIISDEDIVLNRAAGYKFVKGQLKNQDYVSPSFNRTADGCLYFTALDFAKWDASLYTDKILSQDDLKLMWTPVKLNNGKTYPYGFGWFIGEVNNHKLIEHGGSWQGFLAYIARYVDDKTTVIVLINADTKGIKDIAHHIAGLYNPALMPSSPSSFKGALMTPTNCHACGSYDTTKSNS